MRGVVSLKKSVRRHALNNGWTYSIMIILHLYRIIVCMLRICRHAMARNMGSVVNLRSRLHLNRLYEINKKKNLITRIEALFTKQHAKGGEGFRREYYSPRTEDLNWRSSQRVYWASGTLVLAD